MNENKNSILQTIKETIHERVDQEVAKAVDNLLDTNTDAKAKRKITLTIEMKPEDDRKGVSMAITAQTILAPASPVTTTVVIGADEYGGTRTALGGDEQRSVAAKMTKIAAQIL